MESASTFGQWLKQRRHELDLTQDTIAEALGCSSDTIRKIESGQRRPSRQIAELLANILQIDPQERSTFVLWARGMATPSPAPGTRVPSTTPSDARPAVPYPTSDSSLSLPVLPTPLIGREHDLAALKALMWRSTTRLVTLLGPPGIGKTNLSIALASALQADFKDGLTYVPLSPISDSALVIPTLAEAVGVSETSSRPLVEGLQDALREKQMLLILDNFEQVVPAASALSDLLAVAPQLKILVTSRSPLHLRGEKLVEIPPLKVPNLQHLPPLEELAQIGSVALFVERVQAVHGDFELTPENAPLVAAICARLDGLPLAIELAAARTRVLSLSALLSRLEHQLAILTGGPRDAPLHQRALRDALESSYKLLSADQQKLFRHLGIFDGPFTLEAAERVAGATLDGLEAILDQSLLRLQERPVAELNVTGHNGDTEPRFAMLVPVREYAVEQLDAAGEDYQVSLNHAHYFLDLALAGEVEMKGPTQKKWLDRIESAYSDIRSTLNWTLKHDQSEIALRMVAILRLFWLNRGYRQEGLRWMEQALAQGKDAPAEARAEGLNAIGVLANRQGLRAEAVRYLMEAVALSKELGNKPLIANTLLSLGLVLTVTGDYARAAPYLDESEAVSREIGDSILIAKALSGRARIISRMGDHTQAMQLYEEALAIRRQLGALVEIAVILQNLGSMALRQQDYPRAIAYAEECAAIATEVGSNELLIYSLGLAANASSELGKYEVAAANFGKVLSIVVEMGMVDMIAYVFEEIARIALRTDQAGKAARLFGAAEALRESAGIQVDAPNRADIISNIETLKGALSEPEFNAAWTIGRAMSLPDAASFAKAISPNK